MKKGEPAKIKKTPVQSKLKIDVNAPKLKKSSSPIVLKSKDVLE